jgi:ribulose-phosphate 3-epimerase
MVEVIPTVLTNDIKEVQKKIALMEGKVKRVQIDIIDGQFANNKTIDPSAVEVVDTTLNLDFHLMTKEPIDWVERAVRGGADRIIGQIERMASQMDFLGKVQELGVSVGLAIDLESPVSALDTAILPSLDVVLVMSVKAGFGGQEFDRRVFDKIKGLDRIRAQTGASFKICVDGGIIPEVVGDLVKLGVDEIAVGGRLFDGDLEGNIQKYQKA